VLSTDQSGGGPERRQRRLGEADAHHKGGGAASRVNHQMTLVLEHSTRDGTGEERCDVPHAWGPGGRCTLP
jgi:hypothetical protein